MKLETFFEHFDLLIDVPNAAAKLREIILQLAVQGKLVPQDPNDEDIEILIDKITKYRDSLTKNKTIRKGKSLPPVDDEEEIFTIPETWRWVRLGNLGDWGAGATPDRKRSEYYDGSIYWFKSGELNNAYISESEETITDLALKECSLRKNKPGDILIAMYGATIGKVAVLETHATTNQAVCACTCFEGVYNLFLLLLLKAYKDLFSRQGAGGAQPNISREKIIFTPVPLPPLAEQKRIVAKVDALLALCDAIDKHQQQRQQNLLSMNDTALAQLLAAQTPDDFQHHWHGLCDNFDLLYSVPETIPKLRQAILQLAVQGKLECRNIKDESISVLLSQIEVRKKEIIKLKGIKKIKTLPIDSSFEPPFEIPSHWRWTRLGEISQKLGAGSTPLGGRNVYAESGIKFLRSQNVWNDGLRLANVAYISPEIHQKMSGTAVEPGDILLNITGASIGRSAIVPEAFDEANVSQHVSIVRLIDKSIRRYIHLCIISSLIQTKIAEVQVGISREGLSMTRLKDFPLPLPPLAEQKRIVAKVDALLALCDTLETKLNAVRNSSATLMDIAARQILVAQES